MTVVANKGRYLASGVSVNTALSGFNMLSCGDRGYLFYQCSALGGGAGGSAIFHVQVSHDNALWTTHSTYTATATQTGAAQLTAYFPYIRCQIGSAFSGAQGTGQTWVHYTPMPRMGS